MQLINEQNNTAIRCLHIVQHRLQTFLKLAAVFGTGNERPHIQREDLLVLQRRRNISLCNSLCQSLNDGRFANAGLTDDHRVIFGLAGKDLNDAADFLIPSDDRIHLLLSCLGNKLFAVFFQRIIGALRVVRGHPLIAANSLQRLQKGLP